MHAYIVFGKQTYKDNGKGRRRECAFAAYKLADWSLKSRGKMFRLSISKLQDQRCPINNTRLSQSPGYSGGIDQLVGPLWLSRASAT